VRTAQLAHTTIGRFSVRGPSRLAQKRMAVREGSVTRAASTVKTYTTDCSGLLRSTRARRAALIFLLLALTARAGLRFSRHVLLWRFFGRRVQVFVEPGEDAVEAVDLVFFFLDAVTFARVHHEFGFDAIAF
jgi:hypothetical protein